MICYALVTISKINLWNYFSKLQYFGKLWSLKTLLVEWLTAIGKRNWLRLLQIACMKTSVSLRRRLLCTVWAISDFLKLNGITIVGNRLRKIYEVERGKQTEAYRGGETSSSVYASACFLHSTTWIFLNLWLTISGVMPLTTHSLKNPSHFTLQWVGGLVTS